MEIGSQELAEECLNLETDNLPDGWTYVGAGSYREAFRGPDDFVYKKNLYVVSHRGAVGLNYKEWETFTELKSRGYVWVPQFQRFTVDNGDVDIMVVQYLRDTLLNDRTNEKNLDRMSEISSIVADSGNGNYGIDPTTGLIYIRDGGNGLYHYARLKQSV